MSGEEEGMVSEDEVVWGGRRGVGGFLEMMSR